MNTHTSESQISKGKRSKEFTPRGLKKMAARLWADWRKLDQGAWHDSQLKEISDRLQVVERDLRSLADRRDTSEAESRDRRLGYPIRTWWTVYSPDELLGTTITQRTTHRIIRQRVPTYMDLCGAAFLGGKGAFDDYKPRASAAMPGDWLDDLDRAWHPYGYEQKQASVGARVDKVMAEWGKRFEKARAREAREARERLEEAA